MRKLTWVFSAALMLLVVLLGGCGGGGESSSSADSNTASLDNVFYRISSATTQTITVTAVTPGQTPTIAFTLTPINTTFVNYANIAHPTLTNADCAQMTSSNGRSICSVQVSTPTYYGGEETFRLSAAITAGTSSLAVGADLTVLPTTNVSGWSLTGTHTNINAGVSGSFSCDISGTMNQENPAIAPTHWTSSSTEEFTQYGIVVSPPTETLVYDGNNKLIRIVYNFTAPTVPSGVTIPDDGLSASWRCMVQDSVYLKDSSGGFTVVKPFTTPFAASMASINYVPTSGSAVTLNPVIYDPTSSTDPKYYQWVYESAPVGATPPVSAGQSITSAGDFYFDPVYWGNVPGDYHFTLKAARTSGEFSGLNFPQSQQSTFVMRVYATGTDNLAVSAGDAQLVNINDVVTLTGSSVGTGAAAAAPVAYSWSSVSPSIVLSNANSATPTFVATTAGTYDFNVTATASLAGGGTVVNTGSTRVVVADPNANALDTMTVLAGNAQVVALTEGVLTTPITLSASTTLTGNYQNKPVRWTWTQTSGPSNPVLSNADTATMSFSQAAAGTYVFSVLGEISPLNDGNYTVSDSAIVTVVVN